MTPAEATTLTRLAAEYDVVRALIEERDRLRDALRNILLANEGGEVQHYRYADADVSLRSLNTDEPAVSIALAALGMTAEGWTVGRVEELAAAGGAP